MNYQTAKSPLPLWQRIVIPILSPLIFLAVAEACVRLSGVETELARNKNFDVAVPVWLLADAGWAEEQKYRIDRRSVRAEDVTWFQNFEEARYIRYRLKPNLDVRAVNPFNEVDVEKQITFRITSNERGFRGRAITEKKPGIERIVTFGDSSTFGWGVDLEETFQELLAERMTRLGKNTEVLNFGIPGYNSRLGRMVQGHYAQDLDPDLIIISFGANDGRFGPETANEAARADEGALAALSWQLRQLESYKLLRRAIFSFYDPVGNATVRDKSTSVVSVSVGTYRANLQRMITDAREGGAKAVMLSVCAPDDYRLATIDVGKREKVPVVDGLDLFLAYRDAVREGTLYPKELAKYEAIYGRQAMEQNWRLFLTSDGCHPNLVGHSLIADALTEAITGTRLLPEREEVQVEGSK